MAKLLCASRLAPRPASAERSSTFSDEDAARQLMTHPYAATDEDEDEDEDEDATLGEEDDADEKRAAVRALQSGVYYHGRPPRDAILRGAVRRLRTGRDPTPRVQGQARRRFRGYRHLFRL